MPQSPQSQQILGLSKQIAFLAENVPPPIATRKSPITVEFSFTLPEDVALHGDEGYDQPDQEPDQDGVVYSWHKWAVKGAIAVGGAIAGAVIDAVTDDNCSTTTTDSTTKNADGSTTTTVTTTKVCR